MADIKDGGALERLKDFFALQVERKIERDMMMAEAHRAAIEQLTPTKAQAAWIGTQFAPGAGITDAAGKMASFPASDVELQEAFSGEPMPSMAEHLGQGGWGYLHAGLQGLGSLGDASYAAGPVVGGVVGSVLKAPAVVGKIAKAALTAQRAGKGAKAGKGIASLDADSLDLLEEINLSGGAQIDELGNVTLYHRTTPEAASKIKETGVMTGKEDRLFFSTKPDGEISGYGSELVKVKIPINKLKLDDIFANEAHVTLKTNFKPTNVNVVSDIDQGIGALPRAGATTAGATNRLNIVPDKNLPKEMAEIETRFTDQLNSDIDGAVEQYRNLPDSDGGRIVNADLARELSPDYVANRTLSAAVHEPASAFTKEHYARLLDSDVPVGKENRVLFTAGGTGAGKTTALEDALLNMTVRSHIIYDTNLSGVPSSIKKIDQALDADKQVVVAFVYRDPIESLTGGGPLGSGAIQRAERMGRTVPVNIHAKTHVRSTETVKDLAEHYDGNPNVEIRLIDNTRGKGKALDAGNDLSGLPKYNYNNLLKEAEDELAKALQEGWISRKVYEGFVPPKTGS